MWKMRKKLRERRENIVNSGVASASGGNTNGSVPEDECNAEMDNSNHSNDLSFDGAGSVSSKSIESSNSSYLEGRILKTTL